MDIDDKAWVLVTGASGDIGFSITKTLLESGYDVVAHYNALETRNPDLRKIAELNNKSIKFIRADFSKKANLRSFIRLVSVGGRGYTQRKIQAVIHCAGLNEKKQYSDITEEDFDRIFAVNTKAPLFITQSLLARDLFARNAAIIFIGSAYSFIGGSTRNMLYTGSKTALLGWHKSLAITLAPKVRVNTVVPGSIDTKQLRDKNNISALQKKKNAIPAGRFGAPEDVAKAVVFLISDKSTYVTGQAIHVNGGLFLS